MSLKELRKSFNAGNHVHSTLVICEMSCFTAWQYFCFPHLVLCIGQKWRFRPQISSVLPLPFCLIRQFFPSIICFLFNTYSFLFAHFPDPPPFRLAYPSLVGRIVGLIRFHLQYQTDTLTLPLKEYTNLHTSRSICSHIFEKSNITYWAPCCSTDIFSQSFSSNAVYRLTPTPPAHVVNIHIVPLIRTYFKDCLVIAAEQATCLLRARLFFRKSLRWKQIFTFHWQRIRPAPCTAAVLLLSSLLLVVFHSWL